tara:strand:- start:540 stop:797 length:258 start_codon:yes stop_codon:yes gene_type:complete
MLMPVGVVPPTWESILKLDVPFFFLLVCERLLSTSPFSPMRGAVGARSAGGGLGGGGVGAGAGVDEPKHINLLRVGISLYVSDVF